MTHWDRECDVLVVGSGAGGVSAAYTAAREGLEVILVEASDRFGGTTAYSGGGIWYPANPVLTRAGVADAADDALAYYRAVVGERTPSELQEAYVLGGAPLISYLEEDEHFEFVPYPWPDYYGEVAGASERGDRHIMPSPVPRERLEAWHDQMRGSLDTERLGHPAPELATGGRALIGRFLLALAQYPGAELMRDAPLTDLVFSSGRVEGAIVDRAGTPTAIRARRGVILAAGGFERNDDMRLAYAVPGSARDSMGVDTNTGAAHRAALAIGASVDLMEQAWWAPGVVQPNGRATFALDIHAGMFVDRSGKRFVNESAPYDRVGRAVIDGLAEGERQARFWLIYDDRAGTVPPVGVSVVSLDKTPCYEAARLWRSADSLGELAALIGVDAATLEESVGRFNAQVAEQNDSDFHRGDAAYDRFFTHGELPLTPIVDGPFHAAAFALSDLGTKGGLRTDARGRVLTGADATIPGLYAAGNTMAAPSGETYPGGGNPIGTSMLFGHLSAMDAVRSGDPAADTAAADRAAADTPPEPAHDPQLIRARITSYLAAVAASDGAGVAAHYATGATIEDPVGSPPISGIAAITEFFAGLSGQPGDTVTELREVRVAGSSAAFSFSVRMRQGDGWVSVSPIDVMTFDEELRITSMRAFYSPEDITVTAG